MRRLAALALAFAASAAPAPASHEGAASPYADHTALWVLVSLDGRPYPARATLAFPELGLIAGQAPCNRYTAAMWSAYPWFSPEPIAATRRACPDLAQEAAFLGALGEMSVALVEGEELILASDAGREMIFTRAQPPG